MSNLLLAHVGSDSLVVVTANTASMSLTLANAQYASISDASQTGLDLTGDLTLQGWIYPVSSVANNTIYDVVSKWNPTGNNRQYKFGFYNNAGTNQLILNTSSNGAGATILSINHAFTTNTWAHYAASYVASTGIVTFVKDGVSLGTASGGPASIFNGNAIFTVGASADEAGDYFDGQIDDVRAYNVARSVADISADRSTQVDTAANLQGSWHFNNDFIDKSGNNNTLTATGSVVFSTNVPFT